MTTTSTFVPLAVPAMDDTMEVSSPAQRLYDEDIDLDFDDDLAGGVYLAEEERMLTDGEQTRPPTATDEVMNDEPAEAVTLEETMEDEPGVIEQAPADDGDEELIDYTDDELDELPIAPADAAAEAASDYPLTDEIPADDFVPLDKETLQVAEQQYDQQQYAGEPADLRLSGDNQDGTSIRELAEVPQEPGLEPEEQYDAAAQPVLEQYSTADIDVVEVTAPAEDRWDVVAYPPADDAEDGEPHAEAELSLDTTFNPVTEGPATPTDTGLHQMIVNYGDTQMPLFKSKRQPEGLLKDDNLASLSLAELLQNCRQRMALKVGEISDSNELVLTFDDLYLRLGEDTHAAFEFSLNDVLETYLQLHQNDGVHEIPPLSLTLSVQPKFTSSLALLKQAAASGQGLQPFALMHQGERDEEYDGTENSNPDSDQYDPADDASGGVPNGETEIAHQDGSAEEYPEDQYDEQEAEQERTDGQTYAEEESGTQGDALLTNTAEQTTGTVENTDDENAAYPQDEEQYEEQQDTAEEQGLSGERTNGGVVGEGEIDTANLEAEPAAETLFTVGFDESVTKAGSTASSNTVQGDQANDSFGKYDDEDLIDWDEEVSLTSSASEPAADGQDDYSTLLTEYEAEYTKAEHGADDNLEALEQVDAAEVSATIDQTTERHILIAAANASDQDITSENAGKDFEQEQQLDGTLYGEEAEPLFQQEDYAHAEEHNGQADTYNEQQEDYEFADTEEQSRTALAFLGEEDLYEHGLEHTADEDGESGPDQSAVAEYPDDSEAVEAALDPEDDIGFDDETTEQHEARKVSQPGLKAAGSVDSPLGKRSFDAAAEADGFGDAEPELKRARSG